MCPRIFEEIGGCEGCEGCDEGVQYTLSATETCKPEYMRQDRKRRVSLIIISIFWRSVMLQELEFVRYIRS